MTEPETLAKARAMASPREDDDPKVRRWGGFSTAALAAQRCYEMADAMLAEREREKEPS